MAFTPHHRLLVVLQTIVLAVVALYFGQPILCPLVLALLLTFLIRPVVLWPERQGVPRSVAIGVVLVAVLLVIGGVGGAITQQLNELASHLDEYRGHIHAKIEALRSTRFKTLDNIRGLIFEISDAVEQGAPLGRGEQAPNAADREPAPHDSGRLSEPTEGPGLAPRPHGSEPQDVRVVPSRPSSMDVLRLIWKTLSAPITMVVVVAVLIIFSLLEFEELRNRVLRLAGQSELTLTTKTLDDVARRISRYLLANAAINGGFGVAWYLGLLVIGVDYAALWGFLAGVLRFLPYIGAPCAAALALGMAILQFPDWTHPLAAAGIYLVLEFITNYFVEPLTYGRTAGVSTVALLVSVVFWTWIWGPMGLLLAVPMTVVLAVLGRHVPQLEPLGILLGDEQALEPYVSFYQRLVADDIEEAAALFEKELAATSRIAAYDRVLLPALALADRDWHRDQLDDRDREIVCQSIQHLLEENNPPPHEAAPRLRIVGCPADGPIDSLALDLLKQVLPDDCELTPLGMGLMTSEKVAAVCHQPFDAVVISGIGYGDDLKLRSLCQRIHGESPELRILVGRWAYSGDIERLTGNLRARGAGQIVTRLEEALDVLSRAQPMRSPRVAPAALVPVER